VSDLLRTAVEVCRCLTYTVHVVDELHLLFFRQLLNSRNVAIESNSYVTNRVRGLAMKYDIYTFQQFDCHCQICSKFTGKTVCPIRKNFTRPDLTRDNDDPVRG